MREDVTVDDREWLANQFETYRPHLRTVAYRMLGSISEAEDAVQETWVRLDRADSTAVENLQGWLVTVIARVCLDMLRARRARHELPVGPRLPEPIVTVETTGDPEEQAELADSVGLALLVVLETLAPSERLAFVLHDMFAVPFEDIAAILGRSPQAARQLASRARRRVRGIAPRPDPDLALQRAVVDAFLAAARSGDFEALVSLLDPDVVFRVDAGARDGAPSFSTVGAAAVAERVLARGGGFAPLARPATVNGAAGLVLAGPGGRVVSVVALAIAGGRIASIDIVADPAKLEHVTLER
jgi:RNA polymerase sigma factor (sigma-70 family)